MNTANKKQEIKEKKQNSEDRILENYLSKYNDISAKKSGFYYFSIVLLNICALIVVMLLYGNTANIVSFKVFWESIDWNILLLIFLIFIGMMLFQTFSRYLRLYSKSKLRRFWLSCNANNVMNFYNMTSVYERNGVIASTKCLSEDKLSSTVNPVELTLGKKIFDKIAFVIFTLMFLVIGLFAWQNIIPGWVIWVAVISLIFQVTTLVLVGLLNDNKQAVIGFVGWLSRFLFKLKLIKDYELFYNKMIDTLVVYNKTLRQNRSLSFVEIMINILVLFLKYSLLYLVFITINLDTGDMFWKLLYMCVVFDLVLKIWPLPKGTLIFEVLFITLFTRVFFEGYVYWAMILYRVFDYFIYIIHYLIVALIDCIVKKFKNKKLIKNSVSK